MDHVVLDIAKIDVILGKLVYLLAAVFNQCAAGTVGKCQVSDKRHGEDAEDHDAKQNAHQRTEGFVLPARHMILLKSRRLENEKGNQVQNAAEGIIERKKDSHADQHTYGCRDERRKARQLVQNLLHIIRFTHSGYDCFGNHDRHLPRCNDGSKGTGDQNANGNTRADDTAFFSSEQVEYHDAGEYQKHHSRQNPAHNSSPLFTDFGQYYH